MSPEAWRKVLESDIWELELQLINGTNILPALWLSYSFLPPQLKRCFAFLSIFPKDYEFRAHDRERIILLWMAEGILNLETQWRVEDVGKEYMDNLISRSFFQRSVESPSVLVMHDLMHDLAMFVSSGLRSSSSKTRHFAFGTHSKSSELNRLSTIKCFRIMLSLGPSFVDPSIQNVLNGKNGECLRALSLSYTLNAALPNSIGNLKHLRYLDLSNTEITEVPSSICMLYNLQSLLLRDCKELWRLPNEMFRLINLRHLYISETPLQEMPPLMCNLKNLQTLSHYVVGEKSGSRIKDLGDLLLLHGSFRITKLENVVNVADVLGAQLKNKKYLIELILEWGGKTQNPGKEDEVLNALEPHPELKNFEILHYSGTKFPSWLGQQSFSDMVKVSLKDCKSCSMLPPLGQLPSLKELDLSRMDGVVSIGDEFIGTSHTSTCKPFPSLEKLILYELSSWKKWSFTSSEEGGVPLFPRLKELKITCCYSLTGALPVGCLPSLESLFVSVCKSLASIFPTSQSLHIDTAYPSLESMTIKYCKVLESFQGTGLPSTLRELEICGCPWLMSNRISWDLQSLSSLQTLILSGSSPPLALGCSFPEEGLLPATLDELRLDFFANMEVLNGKGLQHLTSLRQLSICDCKKLERLPEDGLPGTLTRLNIENCDMLTQRCQRGTGQDWPKIQHIPKIVINRKQI